MSVQLGLNLISNILPGDLGARNKTLQISTLIGDTVGKAISFTPYGALWYLGYKGGQALNINGTATDFNDKDNNLSFLENLGNFTTSFIPGIGVLGTKVDKVDRSMLANSFMYNWEGRTDKYGQKGEGKNTFNVLFGGKKLKEGSEYDLKNINTAIGITDKGNLDIATAKDVVKNNLKMYNLLSGGWDYTTPNHALFSKQGSVLLFSKRTLSKRKYQIGGKAEEILPNWLFYDEDKLEYVTDFYESSPKENILELLNYVKEKLPGWKVWKSPYGQRRYFILTEKEALARDLNYMNKLNELNNIGSAGSLPAHGPSVEIDGKTLYPLVNPTEESTHVDADGRFYYHPDNLKNGGLIDFLKVGGEINVIPSGALHAHKHHLTELAEDGKKFEDVTTKGIPVVVEDEKGNLIQLAEVEKEEIIFRLEVTQILEKLMKEGTDEAAIKAGKILTKEILENTDDKTGQML